MNKETQKTLVYDFIGTAFCLVMTLVLILMFSGCSSDESDPSAISLGGSTEETRIYALSGRAGDVYPKLMRLTKPNTDNHHGALQECIFHPSIDHQVHIALAMAKALS